MSRFRFMILVSLLFVLSLSSVTAQENQEIRIESIPIAIPYQGTRVRLQPTIQSEQIGVLLPGESALFLEAIEGETTTIGGVSSNQWARVMIFTREIGYMWSNLFEVVSEEISVLVVENREEFFGESGANLRQSPIGRYVIANGEGYRIRMEPSTQRGAIIETVFGDIPQTVIATVAGQFIGNEFAESYIWYVVQLSDGQLGYVWSGTTQLIEVRQETEVIQATSVIEDTAPETEVIDEAETEPEIIVIPEEIVEETIVEAPPTNNTPINRAVNFLEINGESVPMGISTEETNSLALELASEQIIISGQIPASLQVAVIPIAFEQNTGFVGLTANQEGQLVQARFRPIGDFFLISTSEGDITRVSASAIQPNGIEIPETGEMIEPFQQVILRIALEGQVIEMAEQVWEMEIENALNNPERITSDFGAFIFLGVGY